MSSLLILTSDDFSVEKTEKGGVLCQCIPNISMILFYSTKCEHCKTLLPIFKKMPGHVGGCQFGIINLSNNREVVKKSSESITPIEFVPYLVLYVDGKPYMRYNGPHDMNEISRFVMDVSKKVIGGQQFVKNVKIVPKNIIPEYTTGVPKSRKLCYFSFGDAY
jgi:thiol-disulfide isomerase/thioredoxin